MGEEIDDLRDKNNWLWDELQIARKWIQDITAQPRPNDVWEIARQRDLAQKDADFFGRELEKERSKNRSTFRWFQDRHTSMSAENTRLKARIKTAERVADRLLFERNDLKVEKQFLQGRNWQ